MPFHELMINDDKAEAIRTIVMNVCLFLPFGLTLPYLFVNTKSNCCKWGMCALLGLLLSVGIEGIQYWLAIGRAEMDDVICNTLGCGLGVATDIIAENVKRKASRQGKI